MADVHRSYIPAAGHDWTLPLYDPLVKLLGGERARQMLVDHAALLPGHSVVEVGCGTGSLLMLIKRQHPGVEAIGLDPDPKALARARRKAEASSAAIQLDRGFADALPYPDRRFDRVFSCFMFHHLKNTEEKQRMLREARRVLRPGGQLHLLDFVQPEAGRGLLARWLHSNHLMKDNAERRVLALMQGAGFDQPRTVARGTMFWHLATAYYRATAVPAS